jgi:glycosyltransferase involved in cell wall biosynthesis
MTDTPAVAVVITCRDLGLHVREALDSVSAQTYQDFEVVVIDHGSTDPHIPSVLTGLESSTRVVHTENRSQPAARNLGISLTRAPYLCMLDADGRLEPTFLAKHVAALDDAPRVAFVSHWVRSRDGEPWASTPTDCSFPQLLLVNTVSNAAMVRRDALATVDGFDETMNDGWDHWDLWISLVERGFQGRILPEILFTSRRPADPIFHFMTAGDRHAQCRQQLVERHARSYAEFLQTFVVERERERSRLRTTIDDLELEYHESLGPHLASLRDDVDALERRLRRVDVWRSSDPALAEAWQTRGRQGDKPLREWEEQKEQLDTDKRELMAALDLSRARAFELDTAANRLADEVTALRSSVSWRVTAPFRAMYERLDRLARPRSRRR